MNILVLAYAISPTRGSEYSVAWNYVQEMSKDNKITVLYGTSGKHMGECEEMETFVKLNPKKNVNYIPVYPNKWVNLLNWSNRHDFFVYTFYFAYRCWQKLAYKKAVELVKENDFDLVHFVGMIGYREPGYLWKLDLPYIWGPISGANNVPKVMTKRMPFTGRFKLNLRTVINKYQVRHNKRLKNVLKNTDILLTASSENQRIFKEIHGKDSICLPENCILGDISLNESKFNNPSVFNLIVVGRLDANKAVNILLEALLLLRGKDKYHLDIIGDGPTKVSLQDFALKNGLNENITFHGFLPRAKAVEMFDNAHLHIITSASEGNPTTIWEAMSYGVPTLSFDHCGMHDTLRDGAGVLVPIQSDYDKNIKSIAAAIDNLLEHPSLFRDLADKTILRAQDYKWEKRRMFFNELYKKCLQVSK